MAPPTVCEMEGRLCLSVFATILSNLSVIIIIFTSALKYKAEHIPAKPVPIQRHEQLSRLR